MQSKSVPTHIKKRNTEIDCPVKPKKLITQYSVKILRTVIGEDRAMHTLNSISLGFIPGTYQSNFTMNCK